MLDQTAPTFTPPFACFAPPVREQSPLRSQITAAKYRPENECLPPLLEQATLPPELKQKIANTARQLIEALRAKHKGGGVEGLIHEYALSSHEGVALMCLSEALLRIPDRATRDALIKDKIAGGDWKSHLGGGRSLFVNAATWGLVVTGKLKSTVDSTGLSSALSRLIARCGEPVIRKGVDMAMRLIGEQFVCGETIEEALKRAKPFEARGFRYSYDMLGEAATTAQDAARYYRDYEAAIHAIGKHAAGQGIHAGAGISIKLTALHPRYSRAQADRVMAELLGRVKTLALLCKNYDIGLNIDAEEAERLEISLDILEELCCDEDLQGWNGLGFVVQAYGRRCPFVIDFLIDLARRCGHRLMVRLVKGAYWDSEIKRAQIDGLPSFPVYTRKVYTDVCYIACARKMLEAADWLFPQFATHNAQTLATIYHLAQEIKGDDERPNFYEFQCLHGMGESLYDEVVGEDKLGRPARIYAPVGTHETLLAYLVRRLLENGANSSFVNRIADKKVSVEELIADPVDVVQAMEEVGAQHGSIAAPAQIFGMDRANSAGLDLSDENVLADLTGKLRMSASQKWQASSGVLEQLSRKVGIGFETKNCGENKELEHSVESSETKTALARLIVNPADNRDKVGKVFEASPDQAKAAAEQANNAAASWRQISGEKRATILTKAADLMQANIENLMGLIMREAGKSAANAIAEVREAIDFLRYYAAQARGLSSADYPPLGVVLCISPWNFPLAIFTGQIAAALAAGNAVLAKPAEETPLIAAQAVAILHEAGVPAPVLQLVVGDGQIGAVLVKCSQVAGVMFTGSTEVAKLIQSELAGRLGAYGQPIPLIAETGGQNAMIVDSSALAEQVVFDVIASSFDSAGQRCSALRILCLQEDIADRTLTMLKGALHELRCGRTDFIGVDVGPVITSEAKETIEAHISAMREAGLKVEQLPLDGASNYGTFVAPTIIELESISQLKREIFGPVLHIIRFRREDLDRLIDDINATGYGLTFGLHTRIDEVIDHVANRVKVGNIYVNRNIIGAVVGSQPFGGRGLSGTGPKAGGPLYLGRLLNKRPQPALPTSLCLDPALASLVDWLETKGEADRAILLRAVGKRARLGLEIELPGPVGEANHYSLHPRGKILLLPQTQQGMLHQIGCVLATGNQALISAPASLIELRQQLPDAVLARISWEEFKQGVSPFVDHLLAGALIEGEGSFVSTYLKDLADRGGPLILTQSATSAEIAAGEEAYCLDWLVEEVVTSINTTAAGGNASLMSLS